MRAGVARRGVGLGGGGAGEDTCGEGDGDGLGEPARTGTAAAALCVGAGRWLLKPPSPRTVTTARVPTPSSAATKINMPRSLGGSAPSGRAAWRTGSAGLGSGSFLPVTKAGSTTVSSGARCEVGGSGTSARWLGTALPTCSELSCTDTYSSRGATPRSPTLPNYRARTPGPGRPRV